MARILAVRSCAGLYVFLLCATISMVLDLAFMMRGAEGGQEGELLDWREYWALKFPSVDPPGALQELASPLSTDLEAIQASFICISRTAYSFCLCTHIDVSVCAETNAPFGPVVGSTCVFHFFYEYHTNCRPPLHQPSDPLTEQPKAFFHSSYLSIGSEISFPPLANDLLHSQTFLPRPLADMLPFQSSKLSESLALLHVPSTSPMADSMEQTLQFCEDSPQNGESLQCITSIESLVDFASDTLGSHATVISPSLWDQGRLTTKIDKVVNMTTNLEDNTTTCHNLVYPYLVYGCHATRWSSVLSVSFEGIEGHALVVCHHNTSIWNPNHPAFVGLEAKPGDGQEICHWIPHHHFVWVP